ncbi:MULTISPECIES: MobV family relaxase [unclassified Desulfovibrio]|uniref:MobV family relaxase n=1 Tax=unclassified Desulfovibrio TaxID=2593640 RepID=UPI000F5DF43F|nr:MULTISPECIES: MobV family relaxase [unclassified Desulfovibrio]RRD72422.1 plasmid recombination protein [Desulfovibrio sp. OH1209_COT-279]RRD88533.1 plasmid recombination protein [Desulfovibrio sp. OH1186_COT-070]
MSYLVFHMNKFKKEAVRGIQSHNTRERESHSNPDIDYSRSPGNYELIDGASPDYARAVQNRIDDLLLTKAVRRDAVHMCGLIVSSDREFFRKAGPEETRRFFEESKAFLTEFVGKENVISAMVHMDEKTPHMHFLHVPVTKDGRLNANSIYTRESLKILQTEFHRHLHSKGFDIQRGVEQEPGAKKKHLDTREFKQQQEALNEVCDEGRRLVKEVLTLIGEMGIRRKKEAELEERLQSYETQAHEAEKILREDADIPEASMFSFKPALEKAQQVIALQKQALATKKILAERARRMESEVTELRAKVKALEAESSSRQQQASENTKAMQAQVHALQQQVANMRQFLEQPSVAFVYNRYCVDLKAEQEQREREAQAQREALERQQAQEREHASQPQQPSAARGMRMGR